MKHNLWIRCRKPNPQARFRLFCLPYAGGGVAAYHPWVNEIPPDIEVSALQMPGRETRLQEPPFKEMSRLIDALMPHLLPLLDKPFAIYGHSMGTLIGHEIVRYLAAHKHPLPVCFFVAARRAPHLRDPHPPIHALDDQEFLATLDERYGGVPEVLWQNDDLLQLMLPPLRADMTLVESYLGPVDRLYNCPIVAFGGLKDRHVSKEGLQAWQEHTSSTFAMHLFPGGHFFLNEADYRLALHKIILQTLL